MLAMELTILFLLFRFRLQHSV